MVNNKLPATIGVTVQTIDRQTKRMKITKLYKEFFEREKADGLVLIVCTILSLKFANSPFGANYHDFFQTQFSGHSFQHWIITH